MQKIINYIYIKLEILKCKSGIDNFLECLLKTFQYPFTIFTIQTINSKRWESPGSNQT